MVRALTDGTAANAVCEVSSTAEHPVGAAACNHGQSITPIPVGPVPTVNRPPFHPIPAIGGLVDPNPLATVGRSGLSQLFSLSVGLFDPVT